MPSSNKPQEGFSCSLIRLIKFAWPQIKFTTYFLWWKIQISKQIIKRRRRNTGYVFNATNADICYESLCLMKTWIHLSQPEAMCNVNNLFQVGCFFFSVLMINKVYSDWTPYMDVTLIREKHCIKLILNTYNTSGTEACQKKITCSSNGIRYQLEKQKYLCKWLFPSIYLILYLFYLRKPAGISWFSSAHCCKRIQTQ